MGALFSWLLRYIGWPGVLLVGLFVYEEGLPGAHRIAFPDSWPVVGGFGLASVPIFGDLTTGRVHAYAAEQVALAKASVAKQCDFEKSQMVSRATADALAATLLQERRFRDAADIAAADAQKRAGEALRAKEEADARLAALQESAAKDGLPTWTAEELRWLDAH